MKTHIPIALMLAACVGCSGKSADTPTPEPEKAPAAEEAPEQAAAEAEGPPGKPPEAAPEPGDPARIPPPKVTIPVIDAGSFGGVTADTPLDEAALSKALPGFEIKRFETEAEGDTYVNFGVSHDGKQLAVIARGAFGLAVNAVEPAIKDTKGVGLASTFSAFKAAWPEAKCELFELKERIEGIDPFSSVDCKRPDAPTVWYRFDVTGVKHGGELPADTVIADRPLTTFTVDYGRKQ